MAGMEYRVAAAIRFRRRSYMEGDPLHAKQINIATCTVCGQEMWTSGDPEGITGIGELNRMVADHRREHRAYDVPPHAPRRS